MIKRFFAWVRSLFLPANVDESRVDEYVRRQAFLQRDTHELVVKNKVTLNSRELVAQAKKPKVSAKPLNEKLKGVELPVYAKGKVLPPKAKRQFIANSKSPVRTPRRDTEDTVNTPGVDPVSAAIYGYTAGTIMASDEPKASSPQIFVDECDGGSKSSSSHSYSSSGYDSSHSSSSSSSSYDSGSSDSGSSSSSCD